MHEYYFKRKGQNCEIKAICGKKTIYAAFVNHAVNFLVAYIYIYIYIHINVIARSVALRAFSSRSLKD
jgi:hypothetical protein